MRMRTTRAMPNGRDITSYLKGLAILEVPVDQYVYARFTHDFEHYGNAVVALFFWCWPAMGRPTLWASMIGLPFAQPYTITGDGHCASILRTRRQARFGF